MESLQVALVARSVEPDADPLPGSLAVADVDTNPDGTGARFNVRLSDRGKALLGMLDPDDYPMDESEGHWMAPRYELVEGVPDLLCAWLSLSFTPLPGEDGAVAGMAVESGSMSWLTDDAARGATVAFRIMVAAANGDGD
ncbi:hypothetical protein [Bifidobacterium felsineum]|uniref:hypothetical protein n=1 Tax=Bifidobacterium felsineum TaxID=2045440 RepID=UPI001BDC6C06|nr:hypothetical protein [Bifidobacterium felsineum]MBT1164971.1 hypothetical protein [Bifidobacterium felsineum]